MYNIKYFLNSHLRYDCESVSSSNHKSKAAIFEKDYGELSI